MLYCCKFHSCHFILTSKIFYIAIMLSEWVANTGDTYPEHQRQVLHRLVVQSDATLFGGLLVVVDGLRSELTFKHLQKRLSNPPPFTVRFKLKIVRIHLAQTTFEVVGGLLKVFLTEADARITFLRRGDVPLAQSELLPPGSSSSLPSGS